MRSCDMPKGAKYLSWIWPNSEQPEPKLFSRCTGKWLWDLRFLIWLPSAPLALAPPCLWMLIQFRLRRIPSIMTGTSAGCCWPVCSLHQEFIPRRTLQRAGLQPWRWKLFRWFYNPKPAIIWQEAFHLFMLQSFSQGAYLAHMQANGGAGAPLVLGTPGPWLHGPCKLLIIRAIKALYHAEARGPLETWCWRLYGLWETWGIL